MIKSYLILFFILIKISICYADDTYPLTYKLYDFQEGGRLLLTKSNNDSLRSFFIKPGWAGESEMVSTWKGIKNQKIKGVAYEGINILYSWISGAGLIIVYEENKRLFVTNIDSELNTISLTEIYYQNFLISNINIKHYEFNNQFSLLLINKNLYLLNTSKNEIILKFLSSEVESVVKLESNKGKFAYIKNSGGWSELFYSNLEGKDKSTVKLQLSSEIYIHEAGKNLAIVSGNKYSPNSWLHLISESKGIITKKNIPANAGLIKFHQINKEILTCYLSFKDFEYTFSIDKMENYKLSNISKTTLPQGYIESKEIYFDDNNIFLLFRNGLLSVDKYGSILSSDFYPFGEYFDSNPELIALKDFLVLSSVNSSLVFTNEENNLWLFNRFLDTTGKVIFPFILILIILFIYRKFRRQKRLATAMLELPSAGVVFVLDKNGRLLSCNESGKKMLRITDDVPMRRVFQYYCDIDVTKPLKELVDKAINLRIGFTQKINILSNEAIKEWFFSAIILKNFSGNTKGFVLTGIDITEELERRRINNWAQLAHDMQTNLSTIRLNAEQLDCESDEANLTRRKKIIHQVLLLIERVRDIVTVGRSDKPEWQSINAKDMIIEVRNEFDNSLFPDVEFLLELKEFNVYCDKPKMIRALRNAIENGIRSLNHEKGNIILSNWSDSRFSHFMVKDTGQGMDVEKRKKMLIPYFSTSKKEGGAGIGTMIMQNVMLQHGGEMRVNSEPGKGTEVIFSIPNFERMNTIKSR